MQPSRASGAQTLGMPLLPPQRKSVGGRAHSAVKAAGSDFTAAFQLIQQGLVSALPLHHDLLGTPSQCWVVLFSKAATHYKHLQLDRRLGPISTILVMERAGTSAVPAWALIDTCSSV